MFHAIVTDYLKKIEIGYLWSKRKSNTVTEIFFIHKPHVTQLSPLWGSIHSVSIVLPLCLAETHHRQTGTSWKKKQSLTLLLSGGQFCTHGTLFTFQLQCDPEPPRSVMILGQWKAEIFAGAVLWSLWLLWLVFIVVLVVYLLHSRNLVTLCWAAVAWFVVCCLKAGCWQPLAGIQEAKQNTTPPVLACLHWEAAAAMASGGFGFVWINFVCPPSSHLYLKNSSSIAQQQMHINIKQNFHYHFQINIRC